MRKPKLFLILSVFLFSGNLFAQSGWQWVQPFPQGNNLTQVKFTNARVGYAVGDYTLMKTTNGGTNWILLDDKPLYKVVYAFDSNNVIVGGNGLYKTTNGGINWVTLNTSMTSIGTLSFMNENIGFITNRDVYKTTDGGISWAAFTVGSFPQQWNDIVCTSASTAYLVGRNTTGTNFYESIILKTTNQGNSWSQLYNAEDPGRYGAERISFVNDNTGYVFTSRFQYGLVKTTNGGVNWTVTQTPNLGYIINANFFEGGLGYAAIGSGGRKIYKTTNDGLNWISLPNGIYDCFVNFVTPEIGFAVGTGGQIIKTTDFGANWVNQTNRISVNNRLKRLKFTDENTGYVIGDAGFIYKTTNTGNNWVYSQLGNNSGSSLFFLDNNTGFVASLDLRFYRTTNGAQTWDTVSKGQYNANSMHFFNVNTGFASASTKILKTTNSGVNWSEIQTFPYTINDLQFCNNLTGYAYMSGLTGSPPSFRAIGYIYKTTNAGTNWFQSIVLDSLQISKIKFVNSSTGYMLGLLNGVGGNPPSQRIYKTVNGGLNWNIVYYGLSYCINITGENDVYGPGLRSTNAGLNWFSQSVPYSTPQYDIYDMQFVNSNTGIMIGGYDNNAAILKTTDGGGVLSEVFNFSSATPEKFSLKQNYPNPFNPSTKINYEIKSSGFVSLKVFDLLGKEVATLVNEKQNAGSYEVDFNSSEFSLPSGIYFYTLNAGEFTETRKMILIK